MGNAKGIQRRGRRKTGERFDYIGLDVIVFDVKPLIKTMFSPSGSHCRSFLIPPSTVNFLRSEPSTFMTQISLLATNAILSAPPKARSEGMAVLVGVGGRGVSVAVDSISTTDTLVGLSTGAVVSVGRGIEVDVLTGASVGGEFLPSLRKKSSGQNRNCDHRNDDKHCVKSLFSAGSAAHWLLRWGSFYL